MTGHQTKSNIMRAQYADNDVITSVLFLSGLYFILK